MFWPLAWLCSALPVWPEEDRVESSLRTMCQGRKMPLKAMCASMPVIISLGFCAGTLQV